MATAKVAGYLKRLLYNRGYNLDVVLKPGFDCT